MRLVKAFGHFLYDFIIGDDYKIAVAVVVALGLTAMLMTWTSLSDAGLTLAGGALIVAAFAVSLRLDTRTRR